MVAAYAALVLWIGAKVSRRNEDGASDSEWILAGRSLPTGAVLASMVATELSAATFIGVPHAAYSGNWTYLQFAFGALLGKWIVSRTFIPRYHELEVETVYGFAGAALRTPCTARLCGSVRLRPPARFGRASLYRSVGAVGAHGSRVARDDRRLRPLVG